jgi:hypothetical protein
VAKPLAVFGNLFVGEVAPSEERRSREERRRWGEDVGFAAEEARIRAYLQGNDDDPETSSASYDEDDDDDVTDE